MRKIINSATEKYEDELTDNLVLDAVPTVNSFNSVTSDAVARAVAGASGEVPQVTENDNGKVLTAIYDEGGPAVEWAEGGSDYSAGTGVAISDQGAISVKIDGSTITTNGEGQLVAAGGGSGEASVASGTNAIKPLNTTGMNGGYSTTVLQLIGYEFKRLYLTMGTVSTSGYTEFHTAGGKFNLVVNRYGDTKYAICEGCLAPTGYTETLDGGIEITSQLTTADITVSAANWRMSDGTSVSDYLSGFSVFTFYVTISGTTGGAAPNGEKPINLTSVYFSKGDDESVVGVWAPVVDASAAVEVTTSSTPSDVTAILNSGKIPYMTYNNARLWYAGSDGTWPNEFPVFTGFSTIVWGSTTLSVYSYSYNRPGGWELTTISLK